MAVDIQQFNDNEVFVNDKLVVKDSNDNWIAKVELTSSETEELQSFLKRQN
ncbi:hypothetical protein HSX10_03530 [Winogradskyella undariae]|jgi:hypothetical protein|uniref:hypothetical protein n=1 Tax=Winogradskyella undariae TaxID=1285465 RepID=UPI00156AEB9A|nr:hypothetical protein [Winogradskyella undariae]NRR90630.1 hypothetical protein [Winogradskyella undariae]